MVNRRQLLQIGATGALGLSLPQLLHAGSDRAPAKSCIFIVLSGGLSHIDSWDPKPDAAKELRGPYKPISTATPGTFVTERFPQLAKRTEQYCLLRSQSHADAVHVTAAHTMLSGQRDGSRSDDSPFIGSLVSKFRPSTASMPSHVWLHNMKTGTNKVPRYNSGLSKVGYAHAPVRIGEELDNPAADGFRVKQFDAPEGLNDNRVRSRLSLLSQLDRSHRLDQASAVDNYQTSYQRAMELVTGKDARQAFDLNRESDKVRDRYGRHPLGQYLLMARRLVEAGVRLVTVTGWPGLAPGETEPTVTQVWDTHDSYYSGGEDHMFGNGPYGMKWAFPRLDEALATLLDDLQERGLLDETLVVANGEFGRTPKFEGKGNGRGHWPFAYTGLLAGGGIQGGAVYGASDKEGAYVASGRPVNHLDFGATIFHALGIPPETRYGPDGFSFRASEGQPLTEIFA